MTEEDAPFVGAVGSYFQQHGVSFHALNVSIFKLTMCGGDFSFKVCLKAANPQHPEDPRVKALCAGSEPPQMGGGGIESRKLFLLSLKEDPATLLRVNVCFLPFVRPSCALLPLTAELALRRRSRLSVALICTKSRTSAPGACLTVPGTCTFCAGVPTGRKGALEVLLSLVVRFFVLFDVSQAFCPVPQSGSSPAPASFVRGRVRRPSNNFLTLWRWTRRSKPALHPPTIHHHRRHHHSGMSMHHTLDHRVSMAPCTLLLSHQLRQGHLVGPVAHPGVEAHPCCGAKPAVLLREWTHS